MGLSGIECRELLVERETIGVASGSMDTLSLKA